MKTKFLAFMFSAVTLAGAFSSCGDDEEESGSGSVTEKSFIDVDGQRVKSVGRLFNVSYDDNGDILSYYCDEDSYEVSLKPFKLVQEDDNSSEVYEIKFNGLGFISSIVNKYSYDGGYGSESSSTTAKISYNKNGQIESVSITGSGKETYEGETVSWKGSGSETFTYSGSVLTKAKYKVTETASVDGKSAKETWAEDITFEYDDDNENSFFQYTPRYAECVLEEFEDLMGLAFVGMFGKASSKLPSTIKCIEYEDGEEEDVDNFSCYYSYKSNGAIKSADGYDYTYTSVGTRATVEEYAPAVVNEIKERMHFGKKFFRRHSHK